MESKDRLNNVKEKLKSINLNNKFEELKSDFFLQMLFIMIPKPKSLELIKYNKYIQKRIRINFNDYKSYSETYSTIEIEIIIPMKNKNDKFINIKKEDRKYYHIFFNSIKKEEIKRMNLNINNKFYKINIIIDHQVDTLSGIFRFIDCVESINFKRFSRNNITNMSYMFDGCSSLKELNLSHFNTDNVTDMNCMFSECSSLTELNFDNFNTKNVTNMSYMFYQCFKLEKLNLSNFDTKNVKDMGGAFSCCPTLKKIKLSNFKTQNVINMSYMFYSCKELTKLDLSNFITNNLILYFFFLKVIIKYL